MRSLYFALFFLFSPIVWSYGTNSYSSNDDFGFIYEEESENTWKDFGFFRKRFNKVYQSIEEFEYRFSVFKDNMRFILDHNMNSFSNFSLGVNQFTDLTNDEYRAAYIGGARVGSYGCSAYENDKTGAAAAKNWVKDGAVTSVKDQGQCGSCWTFSATGAIEGAMAVYKNYLVDLSEQELVDCATGFKYGSHGCNGGQMEGAFKYVIENGQCALSEYPYVSGTTKTANDACMSCDPVAQISKCYDVKPNDEISLKNAVFQQPVAVAIEADTRYFQMYSNGVLDSAECGTQLDHGVLTVGYGEENGVKYWLVKNSWSTSWGEDGYVKIGRSDSTNDPGICGIAMDPSFPVV
jgi:C1A family cysteine protease